MEPVVGLFCQPQIYYHIKRRKSRKLSHLRNSGWKIFAILVFINDLNDYLIIQIALD